MKMAEQETVVQASVYLVRLEVVKERVLFDEDVCVKSPGDVAEVAKKVWNRPDRECMVALALDANQRVNAVSVVHVGAEDAMVGTPRDVVKFALCANGRSVAVAHFTPALAEPLPRETDVRFLAGLVRAGDAVGIDVFGYVLIGSDGGLCGIKPADPASGVDV